MPPSAPSGGSGSSLAVLCVALLSSCAPTEDDPLAKTGPVVGTFRAPEGLTGDAWLFLYRPGEGPPGAPAEPVAATAVSALRLPADPHFVFGQVPANPYRLWGFLDVDSNFDPQLDVLAQPGAGDRVGDGVELQVQPGRGATQDYRAMTLVEHEPPAFVLEGVIDDVGLDQLPGTTTPLTLVSDPLGRFDRARTLFPLGLVDADGDGRPDDVDGDGVPDLSLRIFLRWRPRPGQLPAGASVLVPMAFDPTPVLRTLNGQLGVVAALARLQAYVLPAAQQITVDADGKPRVAPFGTPPAGDYELVVLSGTGQYWRLPNGLAEALPSQAVRLHFDRVTR
ncbi:MAG: hypothetical protein AB1730_18610 [Myxococcota bacterium]